MGKRNTRKGVNEFPFLAALGLKTSSIRGDGNCLFRAFSDQLHGDQSRSTEIRQAVVDYMRRNPDDFKPFVYVEIGGGFRRNPKRKNAAAACPLDTFSPTPEQIDEAWEQYLTRMSNNGEYGDNLEIRAFAASYKVDVRVYRMPALAYFIKCGEELMTGEQRQIIHIALNAEHYSSVRNINGPETGLPHVKPSDLEALTASQATSTSRLLKIEKWMINSVTSSLPNFVPEATIIKLLQSNKCNVDATVSQLLEDFNADSPASSIPSTPESSFSSSSGNYSVVRDEDSDDEEPQGPNKRQARKERIQKEKEQFGKKRVEEMIENELAAMPLLHVSTVMV